MSGTQNRLVSLTRELLAEWDYTRQFWTDAKSREFEQRFLDALMPAVNATVSNIESLERIFDQIRKDCE